MPPDSPQPKSLKRLWRTLLRLNRGYGGANQAAHGALRFGTFVKVVGWLGLLGIVALLLHKMHEIQDQFDPVNRSLVQLQLQLIEAQQTVGKDTQESRDELLRLRDRAAELDRSIGKSTEDHRTNAAESLNRADAQSADLVRQLDLDTQHLHDLEARQAQIGQALDAQTKLLAQNQQALAAAGTLLAGQTAALTAEGSLLAGRTAALTAEGSLIAGQTAALSAEGSLIAGQAGALSDGGAAALAALASLQRSSAAAETALHGQSASEALTSLSQTAHDLEHGLKERAPPPAHPTQGGPAAAASVANPF